MRKLFPFIELTGILLILPCSELLSQVESKPNVLLIYVDDMGYNDLGCYGSLDPGIKTPNIDRLAKEGVLFSNYLSACSVCSPSRAAVLTGRYPQRCGMPTTSNGRKELPDYYKHLGLPQSEVTIAELLKPAGYATAAFGKWHLGAGSKFAPRRQGFEKYVGSLHNFPVGGTKVWYHNEEPQGEIMFHEAHQKLTDATIGFMQEQQSKEKPFFIYLAHYLVHGPWSPNKEFCTEEEWTSVEELKGKMNPKALAPMVRELDHHIGQVLDSIEDLGIKDRTLVVFASDNGPWLPAGSAYPLSGAKYMTLEGGHRVPAMIRWPGRIPQNQRSDEMVSAMDIFPTIAAAVGVALPDDRKIDGYNLLPLLQGKVDVSPRSEFAYYNGRTLEAVRKGNWKMHLPRQYVNRVFWANSKYDPYRILNDPVINNLGNDISEKINVVENNPEKLRELEELAQRYRSVLGDWNLIGSDQALSSYPGDVNLPNFLRERRIEIRKKYTEEQGN